MLKGICPNCYGVVEALHCPHCEIEWTEEEWNEDMEELSRLLKRNLLKRK